METIRVLIADDSSTARMMMRRLLTADPQIEVIGAAANGRLALQQLASNAPDVVLLDIDMPELDGLATLKELRRTHPKLPVIMFSRLTQRGAGETIEALLLGADECVLKPDTSEGLQDCVSHVLLPRIHALARRAAGSDATATRHFKSPPLTQEAAKPLPVPSVATTPISHEAIEVIAIAASTGGPAALSELLTAIADRLTVPVVIVQHMPSNFTGALAERLATKTRLDVREATDLAPLDSARIWIAPGNHHLVLERTANDICTRLNQNPPENECRPAADVLFRSVAQIFGPRALAIVLTGMGQDGLAGCRSVRARGGRILVQDEVTSAVWGMPGQVARAGLADAVLPVEQIGREITQRLMKRR